MTPAFQITADGSNISALVGDRLTDLRVIDEEGFSADRFEMTLDDRDARIEMPETGAEIEIALGYRETALTPLGRFTVDEVRGEGPLLSLSVGGKATDMAGPIRSPRTRPWHDVTLSDIVETIAGEAGLSPQVSEAIAGTHWAYLAQTAESNLHFLTRIARDLDAIAKPAGGTLMVTQRGEGSNAAGETMPAASLAVGQLESFSWSRGEREEYKRVEAEWQETDAGSTRTVTAGSGEPVKKLRHTFATEAEATRACESHLRMAERAAMIFRGKGAGFLPAIFAGGSVSIDGLRPGLDGEWLITRCVHTLSKGGLKTAFNAQKPAPEEDS